MGKQYSGKSEEAMAPILGAEWWTAKKGTRIEGTVLGSFQTKNGKCYQIALRKPVRVNGQDESKVSVGNLAGFDMALRAAGLAELLANDSIILTCTGEQETDKGNNMALFAIAVDRP